MFLQIHCNPYQNPNGFFCRKRKIHPKIHMESHRTLNTQNSLEKEDRSWRSTLCFFKTYYKATVIKTVWYRHKDKYIDKQDRIKSSEIDLCMYGQKIVDKDAKIIQWEKDSLFNKWYLENWISSCKRMKLSLNFIPHIKLIQNGLKT